MDEQRTENDKMMMVDKTKKDNEETKGYQRMEDGKRTENAREQKTRGKQRMARGRRMTKHGGRQDVRTRDQAAESALRRGSW